MVETAAHLTDHVPRACRCASGCCRFQSGCRYFMQRDGAVLGMVLRIFLRVIGLWGDTDARSSPSGTVFHPASAIDATAVAQVQTD